VAHKLASFFARAKTLGYPVKISDWKAIGQALPPSIEGASLLLRLATAFNEPPSTIPFHGAPLADFQATDRGAVFDRIREHFGSLDRFDSSTGGPHEAPTWLFANGHPAMQNWKGFRLNSQPERLEFIVDVPAAQVRVAISGERAGRLTLGIDALKELLDIVEVTEMDLHDRKGLGVRGQPKSQVKAFLTETIEKLRLRSEEIVSV
jgi:hypothetical protein